MLLIVIHLLFAAACGLGYGQTHALGNLVGIENNLSVHVTGGASGCLGERTVVSQESLLIGVYDGHQ